MPKISNENAYVCIYCDVFGRSAAFGHLMNVGLHPYNVYAVSTMFSM
jgi:hypothetical protein